MPALSAVATSGDAPIPTASELSILVVNWNGGEVLRRCLASIAAAPPSVAYDVVVVDNGSTDDSVPWLRSGAPAAWLGGARVHVIENTDNAGFSRATNQAIAHSRAPLLLLLNPDTEVTPGAIDRLIAGVASGPRIGACGPRLLNTDGSLQPSVWPNPPTPWHILVAGAGLWRLVPRRARGEWLLGGHWDHARRRRVPMLFGAAILAPQAVFAEVGGLDERFHMYGEDNEWCLRVTRAGWRLMFEPSATVVHHGGHASGQRWDDREKLRVKLDALFRFQRLSLSRPHRLANLGAGCVAAALQWAWRRIRGRPADETALVLDMHARDLARALRGR